MALSLVIVDNCYLSNDIGVFPVALVCQIFDNYCFRFDGGVFHVLVVCDIVDNNFMMFVTVVVRVAGFDRTDNHCMSLTNQWFMLTITTL